MFAAVSGPHPESERAVRIRLEGALETLEDGELEVERLLPVFRTANPIPGLRRDAASLSRLRGKLPELESARAKVRRLCDGEAWAQGFGPRRVLDEFESALGQLQELSRLRLQRLSATAASGTLAQGLESWLGLGAMPPPSPLGEGEPLVRVGATGGLGALFGRTRYWLTPRRLLVEKAGAVAETPVPSIPLLGVQRPWPGYVSVRGQRNFTLGPLSHSTEFATSLLLLRVREVSEGAQWGRRTPLFARKGVRLLASRDGLTDRDLREGELWLVPGLVCFLTGAAHRTLLEAALGGSPAIHTTREALLATLPWFPPEPLRDLLWKAAARDRDGLCFTPRTAQRQKAGSDLRFSDGTATVGAKLTGAPDVVLRRLLESWPLP